MRPSLRLAALLALSCCAPSREDARPARSAEDQGRARERAQGVCRRVCERTRSLSSQLGCAPPPVGCEERCMLRFTDSMVRCLDELEAGSRCLDGIPASGFTCGGDDGIEQRSTECASEAKALKACLAGPVRPRKPGYVGPTPRRPDRSRPDELFCTPLPGADVNDISYYQHTQARPAGWEIESIRDERGIKLYCFRQIPENPPP